MPTDPSGTPLDLPALRRLREKATLGPWEREGTVIYTLEHDGWRKGEETFRNRTHIVVSGRYTTPSDEVTATAAFIAECLRSFPALDAALTQAAEALKRAHLAIAARWCRYCEWTADEATGCEACEPARRALDDVRAALRALGMDPEQE